ncbi:MAG: hypothetical protein IPO45_02130 [Saprospiraceae bacterium]|nr:hypothetical protein [Candidatus Brachybacter algidus]
MATAFTGDGNRYYIQVNYCSAKVFNDQMELYIPVIVMAVRNRLIVIIGFLVRYRSGCQFSIYIAKRLRPDLLYSGRGVSATDDFVIYDDFGNFSLEVTRLGEECLVQIPDPRF